MIIIIRLYICGTLHDMNRTRIYLIIFYTLEKSINYIFYPGNLVDACNGMNLLNFGALNTTTRRQTCNVYVFKCDIKLCAFSLARRMSKTIYRGYQGGRSEITTAHVIRTTLSIGICPIVDHHRSPIIPVIYVR